MKEFEKMFEDMTGFIVESLEGFLGMNLSILFELHSYGFIKTEDLDYLSIENNFNKEQMAIINNALRSGWMNMEQIKKYIDPSLDPFRIRAIHDIIHFKYPLEFIDIVKSKKYTNPEIFLILKALYAGLDTSDIHIFLNRKWSIEKKISFINALLFKMPFSLLEKMIVLPDEKAIEEIDTFVVEQILLKIKKDNLDMDFEKVSIPLMIEKMGIEEEMINKYMNYNKSDEELFIIAHILKYIHNEDVIDIIIKYTENPNKVNNLINFFLLFPSIELLEKFELFSPEQTDLMCDWTGHDKFQYLLRNVLTPNLSLEEMERIIKTHTKQNNE